MALNWIFGKTDGDPREKQLNDIINTIETSDIKDLTNLYNKIQEFIPEKNSIILEKLLNNMVMVLGRQSYNTDLPISIINVIFKIFQSASETLNKKSIYSQLLSQPRFIPVMFVQSNGIDTRVYDILDALFKFQPEKFYDFVDKSPMSLTPLVKGIAVTRNEKATQLFIALTKRRMDQLKHLQGLIQQNLNQFPATLTTYLVRNLQDLRATSADVVFAALANVDGEYSISIDDIRAIFETWPMIWGTERGITALLLPNTSFNKGLAEVDWIHVLQPKQFLITQQTVSKCQEMINNAKTPELQFCYCVAISYAKASQVTSSVNTIIRLSFDRNEFVAAAALQVLLIWALRDKLVVPQRLVYLTAAQIVDQELSVAVRCLYKAFLCVLCGQHQCAMSLAGNDPMMQYKAQENGNIISAPWSFPGMEKYLDTIKELTYIDYSDSIAALGCVVDMLGLTDE